MTPLSTALLQARDALPGLAVVALVAAAARLSAPRLPAFLSEILIAVLRDLIAN